MQTGKLSIQTPEWVKHAIFYQIFPDRFARSPRTRQARGITFKPWGSPPDEQGYQGGDLRGIVDRLDYLQELGVTALYLNPIFSSASNHRYHTFDYFEVDPLLGGRPALRELLDAAHARDMRVVLDGVFNHASRGFWAFHHILENGPRSPYLEWFHIHGYPLRPYENLNGNPINYEAWWGMPALPKFNTANPGVRDYLFGVAEHWVDFGIDGWRLDVPGDIDDDEFWREFRRRVKKANPEAYIVGEVWHEAQRWLQGDQFDAVMNYQFSRTALSFFGGKNLNTRWQHQDLNLVALDVAGFNAATRRMLGIYDWQINLSQLNLLDSHDMPRALWIVGEDKSALRLCVLFQMTMPGAPCIYYGDEIGLSSAGDPHCRAAFPWNEPDSWDTALLAHYRRAAALRHRYTALRTGDFEPLYAMHDVYAFRRRHADQELVVIFNAGRSKANLLLREVGNWEPVWPEDQSTEIRMETGKIRVWVPPQEAVILIRT